VMSPPPSLSCLASLHPPPPGGCHSDSGILPEPPCPPSSQRELAPPGAPMSFRRGNALVPIFIDVFRLRATANCPWLGQEVSGCSGQGFVDLGHATAH
jgi:hypothetical protein